MCAKDGRKGEVEEEAASFDGDWATAKPQPPAVPTPVSKVPVTASASGTPLPAPPAAAAPVAPRLPRAYAWRATMDIEPGMVIARPVVGITGSRATMHLAVGSMITADTLAQLINKGVECVAILDDHPPDPQAYAEMVDRYQARLRQIFEPEPDATCRPLFDALIENGPC